MSSKFQNGELSSFRDMTDYVESRQLGAQHYALTVHSKRMTMMGRTDLFEINSEFDTL